MNDTYEEVDSVLLEFMNRSPATIAVETSILLLIGLISIGGNLLVIISIYRNSSLRTITNYFVLSLAMTDIFFPIANLPLLVTSSIKSRFLFGQKVCEFQLIANGCLIFISNGMILLMAINRFVRVCKPQKYKKVFNKITSLSVISLVWIASGTGTVLVAKRPDQHSTIKFSPKIMLCVLKTTVGTDVNIVKSTAIGLALVIPICIIVFCYFKVFKKIRQHKRNIAPASNPNSLGTSVQEIKVTWTMFAVLIGYCSTWVPVLAFMLISNIWSDDFLPRQAYLIIPFAGLSSSAVNPVIYGAMNTAFRREYTKILRCK